MKSSDRVLWAITAGFCCLALASPGHAQTLDAGEVEATFQAGIVAGVGTHASFAGSAGKAVTDRIFAFGEFGYVPLGGASGNVSTPGGGFEFATSGRLLSFMGGAQYQFNDTNSFSPYAGAALGLLHSSFSSTVASTNVEVSDGSFYASFAGGARYYVRDNWGFKPEVTLFAGSDVFFRFGVGVFYQFRR